MKKPSSYFIWGSKGFIGSQLKKRLESLSWIEETPQRAEYFFYLLHYGPVGGAVAPDHPTIVGYIEQNLTRLNEALSCLSSRSKNFFFFSSGGAVYGDHLIEKPRVETDTLQPISVYGEVKLAMESRLRDPAIWEKLPIVILRPSNIFGPTSKRGLISSVIRNIREDRATPIFGENGVVRDYLYIDSLLDGILSIFDRNVSREILHLSSGVPTPTLEIVNEIYRQMGSPRLTSPLIQYHPARVGDPLVNVLNPKKMEILTGWKNEMSLSEGIQRTISEFSYENS